MIESYRCFWYKCAKLISFSHRLTRLRSLRWRSKKTAASFSRPSLATEKSEDRAKSLNTLRWNHLGPCTPFTFNTYNSKSTFYIEKTSQFPEEPDFQVHTMVLCSFWPHTVHRIKSRFLLTKLHIKYSLRAIKANLSRISLTFAFNLLNDFKLIAHYRRCNRAANATNQSQQ